MANVEIKALAIASEIILPQLLELSWMTRVSARRVPSSRHDLFDDLAVHVGQPVIAAGVAERELLVVRAKKVQDHRVQVVDLTPVLDGLDPSSSVASRLLGSDLVISYVPWGET